VPADLATPPTRRTAAACADLYSSEVVHEERLHMPSESLSLVRSVWGWLPGAAGFGVDSSLFHVKPCCAANRLPTSDGEHATQGRRRVPMSSLRGRHLRLGLVRLMSRRNSPGFGHFKWAVKSRSRLGRSDARIGAGSEEPNSGNRQLIPASFVPRETKSLEGDPASPHNAPHRTPRSGEPGVPVAAEFAVHARRNSGEERHALRGRVSRLLPEDSHA
jgi:hypothetical protein